MSLCKWYAEFEGVCCNGDCKAHCADSCPFDGYSEDCKYGEEKKPTNFEKLKAIKLYYKMGVMCGSTLYFTYKFDDFEKMIKEATDIKNKYKRDMSCCTFVIQAFKDDSYDFEKSCICQLQINVNQIETAIDAVVSKILSTIESEVDAG